jgi:hexosaminidase
MKNYFWGLALVLVILGAVYSGYRVHDLVRHPKIGEPVQFKPSVMPQPKLMELNRERFQIDRDFSIGYSSFLGDKGILAVNRFIKNLGTVTAVDFAQQLYTKDKMSSEGSLLIMCTREGETRLGESESYTLNISNDLILLRAESELGILHGLETLLQLATSDERGCYFPGGKIEDEPRFAWRGLMIDPCRHFISKETMMRNLDAMAAVKLNVLHLHLSEDQGFRIESKRFPNLHLMGSDGHFLKQSEIKEIIHYADLLGIRVVPEFDMPGHTTAWLVGHPELATIDSVYSIARTWGVHDPVFNPARESTYQFLDEFIGEMAALFPDPYFHIGGDENNGKHWSRSPEIAAFKKEKGFKNNHELQVYFIDRVKELVKKHGKTTIGWGEILDLEMDKAIITQFWWPRMKDMEKALAAGYRGIISNGYYIDLFETAESHWLRDPVREEYIKNPELEKQILGGEATMWAEFVTDELFDKRVWPRTAAIAERFWSEKSLRDVETMYERLNAVSHHLDRLGIRHLQTYDAGLRTLAGSGDTQALKTLVDLLEPVRSYRRHQLYIKANGRKYTQFTPLTRPVDYAWSDAPVARNFRNEVSRYLAAPKMNAPLHPQIIAQLELWKNNHNQVKPLLAVRPQLAEIEVHSINLSEAASIGLEALKYVKKEKVAERNWGEVHLKSLKKMKEPAGELELQIITAIEALIIKAANVPVE